MYELINAVLFAIAAYISFYIPGRALLGELKIKKENLTLFSLCLTTGTAIFLLATYLLAYIGQSQLYLIVLFAAGFVYVFRRNTYTKISLLRQSKKYTGLILLGAAAFTSLMFFSGYATAEGIQFFDTNRVDGILHIALIKNMTQHFPPTHPGLAGVPLQGYHYFYDFLSSRFVLFYNFSPMDMYFRYMHFYISGVYGIGFFLAARAFTSNKIKILTVLTLAYFGQGFTYVVLIFSPEFDSIYGLSQPLQLVFNPLLIFSTGMLLSSFYLFTKIEKNWKNALVVSLILGVTSQIKVHAGLIGIAGLSTVSLVQLMRYKNLKKVQNYIYAGIGAGVVTAVTFLPNNLGAGGLAYAPLVIYTHFLGQEYFAQQQWELRRQIFTQHDNIPRLTFLYSKVVAVYWILGLGIRILALVKIYKLFTWEFWKNEKNSTYLAMILTPLLVGSLFVQSVSPLDTIQFHWMALFLSSLPAGLILGGWISKSGAVMKYSLIFLLVLHSVAGTIFVIHNYYSKDPRVIDHRTQAVFQKVADLPKSTVPIVLPDGYTLTEKQELVLQWEYMPLIAAFSGRSTYYEKEVAQFDLERELKKRENNVERLYTALEECDPKNVKIVLDEIGSDFIVSNTKFPCLARKHFSTIISSEKYSLYKFRQ